ncbi:MAG: sugar transferase [Lachnospiraceae bacterium]|nr:sugar transferase [Lachnospiraceae bacterium]
MYKKSVSGWLKHVDFMILDILCLELSYIFAYILRHGIDNLENILNYQVLLIMGPVALILVTFFSTPYKGILRIGKGKEAVRVFIFNITIFVIIIVYLFIVKQSAQLSRIVVIVALPISMLFMYLERLIWKKIVTKKGVAKSEIAYMVLITASAYLEHAYHEFTEHDYGKHKIVAIMISDQDEYDKEYQGIPVYCHHHEFLDYCAETIVDEVFVQIPDNKENGRVFSTIRAFLNMGTTIHIGMNYLDGRLPNQVVEKMGNYTVLTSSINMMSIWEQVAKRALDILGGIVGCIITGFLFIIFAPIIYIQSRGPVFFSQIRVGKNGRKFKIYKFRSMYMDAEERKKELMDQNKMQGLMFKMDNDPRIIPIGKFIRKTSIDEFPQFFNVLKGDMSLVGTRPPTMDEYERYEVHHRRRLATKPGITGLWQVSGRSNVTDFEEVVRLDTEYIENWSFWLDIKILLKTIVVVFTRKGSE